MVASQYPIMHRMSHHRDDLAPNVSGAVAGEDCGVRKACMCHIFGNITLLRFCFLN